MDSAYTYTPFILRGDRRQLVRAGETDRRSRPRTPGSFNHCCDVAYRVMRKTEQNVSTQTKVPLHQGSDSL